MAGVECHLAAQDEKSQTAGTVQNMKTVEYKRDNPRIREVKCPNCSDKVSAWTSSGMSACFPHFYCDCCSNLYLYEEGKKAIQDGEPTQELVRELETQLPACPCGGRFKAGENPKCPNCRHEFKHQGNAAQRLTDPHMIVLDQACVYSDNRDPYRVVISPA